MANEIEIVITATDATEGAAASARGNMAGVAEEARSMGEATSAAGADAEQAAGGVERLGTATRVVDFSGLKEEQEAAGEAAKKAALSFDELSGAVPRAGAAARTAGKDLEEAGQEAGAATGFLERLGLAATRLSEGLETTAAKASQFGQSVAGAVSGLFTVQGVMGLLIAALPEVAAGFLGVSAAMAATVLGIGAVLMGLDGIKDAFNQFKMEIEPVREAVSQVFDKQLGDTFRDLAAVINNARGPFQDLAQAISDIVKALLPGKDAMSAFSGAVEDAANFFERGVQGANALKDAIGTMTKAAAPELGQIADAISSIYQAWDQAVQKLSQDGTLQQAFQAGAEAIHAFGVVLAAVGTVLTEIAAKAGPPLAKAFEQLAQALEEMGPFIAAAAQGFALIVAAVAQLINIVSGALAALGPFGQVLATIGGAVLALSFVIGPLSTILSGLITIVGMLASGIGALAGVFSGVSAGVAATSGVFTALASAATSVASVVAGALTAAFAGIAGTIAIAIAAFLALGAIFLTLDGKWGDFVGHIQDGLDHLGKAIGDFVTGDWSAGWNEALQAIKSFANSVIDILNSISDVILKVANALSSLLGGTTNPAGFGNIPYFETGGITSRAVGGIDSGLTLVGENGPELVSLPGGSHISSNSSMQTAMGGGGGGSFGGGLSLAVQGGADSAVATMIMQLVRSGKLQIRQSQLVV